MPRQFRLLEAVGNIYIKLGLEDSTCSIIYTVDLYTKGIIILLDMIFCSQS